MTTSCNPRRTRFCCRARAGKVRGQAAEKARGEKARGQAADFCFHEKVQGQAADFSSTSVGNLTQAKVTQPVRKFLPSANSFHKFEVGLEKQGDRKSNFVFNTGRLSEQGPGTGNRFGFRFGRLSHRDKSYATLPRKLGSWLSHLAKSSGTGCGFLLPLRLAISPKQKLRNPSISLTVP